MKPKHLTRNNIILLVCLLVLIILFPALRDQGFLMRDLLLTAIFFAGIFSLKFSTRSLKILLLLGTATAASTWIDHFTSNDIIFLINFTSSFLFLVAIVVLMIRHIARSQNVTPTIILSSINGYLLLGLLGAELFAIVNAVDRLYLSAGIPSVSLPDGAPPQLQDFLYFSFVTLTTLGYGDIIPLSHLFRSTAILVAITGQLYMTILIAMLVGKFLSRSEGR